MIIRKTPKMIAVILTLLFAGTWTYPEGQQ
ncbi:flagellar biosynthesis protein FliQ [Rhizobium leguminosarum]|nr:flagellar biosynthesis protein FliQ [Rhizobium leguminosarum]MBB4521666.1 flagellar biosynthesis protein FliQ [Rhizobium leguminosarum]MBB6294998.1 flagellar biosynthesis protein FliQ [Rhizobium leguminosarum]MDH6658794.1 flagellar biosynthesis protein FliQ [Rhizobium sophorae]